MVSLLTEEQKKELARTLADRRQQHDKEVQKDLAIFWKIIEKKIEEPSEKKGKTINFR